VKFLSDIKGKKIASFVAIVLTGNILLKKD